MNVMRALACGFAIFIPVMVTAAPAPRMPPIAAPELPENYKIDVEQVIRASLRDPTSATLEYRSEPYKMLCDKGVYRTASRIEVWMVDVWVNGTNAYGGYTGFQPMSATLRTKGGELYYQAYTKGGGGALTRFGLCRRF